MSPETWSVVGYILAAFVVGILTHRGDIAKAVQKDIEKHLSAPAATAIPAVNGSANGGTSTLALHSTVTSVDLLAQLVNDLRGDFNADREARKQEMANLRQEFSEIKRRLPPESAP